MINSDQNMGRKQIFKELPLPSKVEKVTLELIYKALFIIVKLLLDSRLNLVKMSEGKPIITRHKDEGRDKKSVISEKPVDNAVIKETDDIIVEKTSSSTEEPQKDEPKDEETKS